MSSVGASENSTTGANVLAPDEAVTRVVSSYLTRFRQLQAEWKRDTCFSSSLSDRHDHPAYKAIVEMGMPAVPIILDELRRDPDWWFGALLQITGADPSPREHRGSLEKQTENWLRWGRENGHG